MAKAAHRVLTGLLLAAATLTTAAALLLWAAGPAKGADFHFLIDFPGPYTHALSMDVAAPEVDQKGLLRTTIAKGRGSEEISVRLRVISRGRSWRIGFLPWKEEVLEAALGNRRALPRDGDLDPFVELLLADLREAKELYLPP